ncbi:MAG: dihydrofolate reductase [Bacilli bacterium]|nr:dihydrofolate reductase [Bacilli bacterium]MDD4547660.1 dihydrofolate reductase [Bacilli bacterium]
MKLTMVISNDDSEMMWKVLVECDFLSPNLSHTTLVLNETLYRNIPSKRSDRRHVIVSPNYKPNDEFVIVFKNNDELLRRLEMLEEEIYMIGDIEMYNYFKNYIQNLYVLDMKNKEEVFIDNKETVLDTELYRISKYKKVEENEG